MSQEKNSPFKIIRVKNRLETGNRDLLINLMYRDTSLVEMQLCLNMKKNDKKIGFSNAFSHYIYELKRSKFGPVTEMCSIWTSKDPRSVFYVKTLQD